MKGHTLTLIVAAPGRFRDSLRALLIALPQIGCVRQANDTPSALEAVTEHRPSLAFLDGSLSGDQAWAVLRQIKTEWPQTRCIALADNGRQQREAQAAGADAVLIKGFPAAKLFETVDRLLPEEACYEGGVV